MVAVAPELVYGWVEALQPDAAFFQPFGYLVQVLDAAAEPVELDRHQHVARSQVVKAPVQFWP